MKCKNPYIQIAEFSKAFHQSKMLITKNFMGVPMEPSLNNPDFIRTLQQNLLSINQNLLYSNQNLVYNNQNLLINNEPSPMIPTTELKKQIAILANGIIKRQNVVLNRLKESPELITKLEEITELVDQKIMRVTLGFFSILVEINGEKYNYFHYREDFKKYIKELIAFNRYSQSIRQFANQIKSQNFISKAEITKINEILLDHSDCFGYSNYRDSIIQLDNREELFENLLLIAAHFKDAVERTEEYELVIKSLANLSGEHRDALTSAHTIFEFARKYNNKDLALNALVHWINTKQVRLHLLNLNFEELKIITPHLSYLNLSELTFKGLKSNVEKKPSEKPDSKIVEITINDSEMEIANDLVSNKILSSDSPSVQQINSANTTLATDQKLIGDLINTENEIESEDDIKELEHMLGELIDSCQNLEHLVIDHSSIRGSCLRNIGDKKNLITLILDCYHFNFPIDLSSLSQLQHIRIWGIFNQPLNLSNLKELRSLRLTTPRFNHPLNLEHCQNLLSISLKLFSYDHEITIKNLPNLKKLEFDLGSLKKAINLESLPKLKSFSPQFWGDNNQPINFKNLTGLNVLSLSIRGFNHPIDLSQTPNLAFFNLSTDHSFYQPLDFSKTPKLKHLKLISNLSDIQLGHLPFLEEIKLYDLKTFNSSIDLTSCPNIISIVLNQCELFNSPIIFAPNSSLKHVTITSCKRFNQPIDLSQQMNLEGIEIWGNQCKYSDHPSVGNCRLPDELNRRARLSVEFEYPDNCTIC